MYDVCCSLQTKCAQHDSVLNKQRPASCGFCSQLQRPPLYVSQSGLFCFHNQVRYGLWENQFLLNSLLLVGGGAFVLACEVSLLSRKRLKQLERAIFSLIFFFFMCRAFVGSALAERASAALCHAVEFLPQHPAHSAVGTKFIFPIFSF